MVAVNRPPVRMKNAGHSCSVSTCTRGAQKRGMCNAHYIRQRRTGSVRAEVAPRIADYVERFRSFVVQSEEGCWGWNGQTDVHGYGVVSAGTVNGRHREFKAHRLSYEMAFGEIPMGMVVMHLCDNPPCTRIDHLRLGTQADNVRDMDAKGRRVTTAGERSWSARLTADDVRAIRRERVPGRGGNTRALAARYGVHISVIGAICNGRKWRSVE